MSKVVQFTGADAPPDRSITDDGDSRHAKAFRDLEGDISDCVHMSQIASLFMPDDADEHVMFTVLQTRGMLERLQKRYYALWEGKERPEVLVV